MVLLLITSLVSACDTPTPVRSGEERRETTARYGSPTTVASSEASDPEAPTASGDGDPPATAPPVEPAAASGVDLSVVDPNGTPRPGIEVRIEGGPGQPIRAVSAAGGKVQRALPPGTYRVHAPEGCTLQLRTLRSSTAELGVAAGATTTGRLVVEVTPRYEVAGPVTYEGDAGWRVGEVHGVQFRLVDPCGGEIPPLDRYDAVRFVASPGVEILRPLSTRVTTSGAVDLELRCTEPDVEVALAMEDALDARRRAEVLDGALMDEQRPPFCLQPR